MHTCQINTETMGNPVRKTEKEDGEDDNDDE